DGDQHPRRDDPCQALPGLSAGPRAHPGGALTPRQGRPYPAASGGGMRPEPTQPRVTSEPDLVALAVGLGARSVRGWSPAEEALARALPPVRAGIVAGVRARLAAGDDPLGDALCRLRSAADRRARGAVYTPPAIVEAMVAWAARRAAPDRIVDPGAGSAR